MGTWEHLLEVQLQEMQPGLRGARILVIIVSCLCWPVCLVLLFSWFILSTGRPLGPALATG